MVSDSQPARRADRAQLILVGAIAIAVILIGLTVVLNSAVFTENVAGGSSAEVSGDVAEFDREAVRDVRSLTLRVNQGREYEPGAPGATELREDVRANVSSYSDVMAESYADTGSVYTNVTYLGVGTMGHRIIQDTDGNFSNDSASTWKPIDDDVEIGWFVVNLDVENMNGTDPFYVELTDVDGQELNVSVRRTASGDVEVNSSIDGGHVSNATCEPRNGRLIVDVIDGRAYAGNAAEPACTFNSTGYLEPAHSRLRIVEGERGHGKYDLVMNDTVPLTGVLDCPVPDGPCRAMAAWTVEVRTHYRSGTVAYNRTHNVSVYDR